MENNNAAAALVACMTDEQKLDWLMELLDRDAPLFNSMLDRLEANGVTLPRDKMLSL